MEAVLWPNRKLNIDAALFFEAIIPRNSHHCIRKVMTDAINKLREDLLNGIPERGEPEVGSDPESNDTNPWATMQPFVYGLFIVQAIGSPYYVSAERWRRVMVPLMKKMELLPDCPDERDPESPQKNRGIGSKISRGGDNRFVHYMLDELHRFTAYPEDYTCTRPKPLHGARRSATI